MKPVILLYDVTARYGEWKALDQVSLEIETGEFVFLVGPTGSGKTTLLNLITFNKLPDEGFLQVLEFNSEHIRPRDLPELRKRVGYVFQDFRLLPDRSVFDNVALALEVMKQPRKRIEERVRDVLMEVGLIGKAHHFPHELSGGERQRVAIARAIVREPLILLADEPTGNLDPNTAWEILDLLQYVHRKGTTVLMATHNYTLLNHVEGKRIVRLERGRILQDLKPASAASRQIPPEGTPDLPPA